MATPPLRHLVALDILKTKFRQSGRPSQFQRDQSELLLTCLNGAWSPFLSARPVGPPAGSGSKGRLESTGSSLGIPYASTQLDLSGSGKEGMRSGLPSHNQQLLRSLAPSEEAGNSVLEAYIHESWGKDVLLKRAVVPVAPA